MRPILYRHAQLPSFASLMLFQRSIMYAKWLDEVPLVRKSQTGDDFVREMNISIDPFRDALRNAGQPPAAIMIARMLQVIVR